MAATRSVVATYFDNATPEMIKFEDVEYNDVFVYDGCLYLKADIVNYINPTDADHDNPYNCFNLSRCFTERLKPSDKVYLATVKIHYQVR